VFRVYILENRAGRFYIGHTDDLDRRVRQHNDPVPGLGKFTHKSGPWELVWSEEHSSRSAAMLREREIKNWRSASRIRRDLLKR
jgi:predicted GIY-YIG superfamily endonuclease